MSYFNRIKEACKTLERGDLLLMDKDTANYLVGERAYYYPTQYYGYWLTDFNIQEKQFFQMIPDCGAFIYRWVTGAMEFIE